MAHQSDNWEPGGRVGRYVLVSPLATGGMAEVWLARQPGVRGFEKVVVIKRMIGALRDDPDHVEMFLSEARLAAGLSHRSIVQIYELGEDRGSFYIAMEFIEGESLARIFKASRAQQRPVPIAIAVQLVAWAAEGLHYAHTRTEADGKPRGIIHRDVSPQNLLVTTDGFIKLVDFGIAKVATEETSSGKLKGKLAYMPPEQARAEPLDARADVFALGVVLFELLTGTRLFARLEDLDILNQLIQERPLPTCRSRAPDVPEPLDALVSRALAPSREARLGSARELQVALEDWLVATGQRVSSSDVAAWLDGLFPNRAAERHAVLEAARMGASVSLADASSLLVDAGSNSRPSKVTPGADLPRTTVTQTGGGRASRAPLFIGLAVVGLLSLGGLLAFRTSPRAAEVSAPIDAGPVVGSVSVEATPGADVKVDGEAAGRTPLVVGALTPGPHHLALSASGHVTLERDVEVKAGERVQLVLALEREAQVVVAPPPVADAGVVAAPAQRPVASKATGKLNLRTTPWTSVYLGKKKLGDTPLVGLTLPAGSHVLRVENPEAGLKSTIEVTVRAGQTTNENLVLK